MSEENDDAVTTKHDGETTGEALDALRAIIAEMRDKYTVHNCDECDFRKSCDERFDSDECKSKRKSISLAFGIEDDYFARLADRIEAAAERVKVAHWCECERKRLLIGRLAQRVQFTRLADPNPSGEDYLLREAQYEYAGTPYAVIEGKPVVVLHGRVAQEPDGRTFVVNRPEGGEVGHG